MDLSIRSCVCLLRLAWLATVPCGHLSLGACLEHEGFVLRNPERHDHKLVPLRRAVSGQVHADLFDHSSLALQELPLGPVGRLGVFEDFAGSRLHGCLGDSPKEDLTLDPAVEVKEGAASLLAELCEVCLELLEFVVARLRVLVLQLLEEGREESLADLRRDHRFVSPVQAALEDEQVGDREEDLSVTALHLLLELRILLSRALDELTEADELLAHGLGYQVGPAEAPGFLEPRDKVDKFRVVPQLRIDHFHILRVPVYEQGPQIVEASLDVLAELPHGRTLVSADLAPYVVRDHEH